MSTLLARSSELDSLISLLDEEIGNKSKYEQIKKNRIDAILSFLDKPEIDIQERYRYNKLLIAEYEKYSYDSDVSNIGTFGVGDYETVVTPDSDLDYLMSLIRQSYSFHNNH